MIGTPFFGGHVVHWTPYFRGTLLTLTFIYKILRMCWILVCNSTMGSLSINEIVPETRDWGLTFPEVFKASGDGQGVFWFHCEVVCIESNGIKGRGQQQ